METESPREGIDLLMTTGPVEVSPRVLAALAQPTTYHYYPRFIELFDETTEMLAKVYGARGKEDVLILQGEAVLGLEASIACTINPGEKVLILENGPFGNSFGEYVTNAGGVPVYFRGENVRALEVEAVRSFLEQNRDAAAVTLVHCETPTGILNPVEQICRRAKELGMLTIVDSVATLGGVPFSASGWGIDISISASQKCVGAPPALALLALNEFAWERVAAKKKPVRNSYLSLLDWKESWLSSHRFPFTPFTNEIYALNAALGEILEEGLEECLRRHADAGRQCRDGVRGLGLELWPVRVEECSPTVTAIRVPMGRTDTEIIEAIVKRHRILISGGFRDLRGKVLRVGTMGQQARQLYVSATLDALADVLKH
ncbi:MAG: alanine--glyoxylate aminotransferase family protein [Thaumarchaeota archaeon]|nr:alanine--glyoxylate aminotransferase family protein [Nitrososphaerota archaeon]